MRRRTMSGTRVTTIRQSDDQADELEFIARIDGMPVSEAIREPTSRRVVPTRRSRSGFVSG